MATDGPTPPPCDAEIYEKGECVFVGHGPSNAVERWVKRIAELSGQRVDWHYVGGRAVVLVLGDTEKVRKTISKNMQGIEGTLYEGLA